MQQAIGRRDLAGTVRAKFDQAGTQLSDLNDPAAKPEMSLDEAVAAKDWGQIMAAKFRQQNEEQR